ncbi:MAG: NAD(P)-dependent oxidoreductase [Clostridia bacterium]|nr:NAD(P)-dependent oxidoreductase [Clostridia bacterium]
MKNIAFIGIGVMGKSMAGHLLNAGYGLHVYTRTKQKAQQLLDMGAVWHDSIQSCVEAADAVCTMVGFVPDVEQVYFEKNAILDSARAGAVLIDFTTTSPALSKRIYKAAKGRGLFALDAPVSGGDVGAKNATLSIMVGGDRDVFELALPLFDCLGTAHYTGNAGSGQHTKMANQIAICGAISGVCEAIAYAKAQGLDVSNMLSCIEGGAAGSWQLKNMAPRMLRGDFAPGFFVKHQLKDLKIAIEEAENRGLSLPVLNEAARRYSELVDNGEGDNGTQALIHTYCKEEL